ncbi:MAG: methylated-DNA--[protein]-cysteine S-methyltransferase [Bacteroidota bacterium]
MNTITNIDFDRIAKAIEFIHTHFKKQPSLDEVAAEVHLSPSHFQRMFTEWAGVSPKKFLQYTSLAYAKSLLKEEQTTLFDTAMDTGLSGTGRLHDLFVTIEGMTPAEYKNGGASLVVSYSFSDSLFGKAIAASTSKGLCYLAFCSSEEEGLRQLAKNFHNAEVLHKQTDIHKAAFAIISNATNDLSQIKLHLKGTVFQLKVWEALLHIPLGQVSTYGAIAHSIDAPGASRAVGSAIGSNPIAYLIPCHRVIQSSGALGGYMWGPSRKRAIMGWEAAQIET